MKENKRSDIPMKLERDSTFVDADFIDGTEIFVMISRNSIYVYKALVNLHIMENVKIESKQEMQNEAANIGVDCDDVRPKDEMMGAKSQVIIKTQMQIEDRVSPII